MFHLHRVVCVSKVITREKQEPATLLSSISSMPFLQNLNETPNLTSPFDKEKEDLALPEKGIVLGGLDA